MASAVYVSHCDISKAPCRVNDRGFEYVIMFTGHPSPLTPFSVKLITEQIQPESIDIEFSMQGMDMGYNQYSMKLEGSHWQSKVILPVCSLGSKEWILKIKVSGKNSVHLTQLKFEQ